MRQAYDEILSSNEKACTAIYVSSDMPLGSETYSHFVVQRIARCKLLPLWMVGCEMTPVFELAGLHLSCSLPISALALVA